MDKDSLTAWALANGWQIIADYPSLTKPSSPKEAIVRMVLKATVVKEVHATFSPSPGSDLHRLKPQTPWKNVFVSGDWTATGWPATMEGAVRAGYATAEALVAAAGKPAQFVVADLEPQDLMKLFRR